MLALGNLANENPIEKTKFYRLIFVDGDKKFFLSLKKKIATLNYLYFKHKTI